MPDSDLLWKIRNELTELIKLIKLIKPSELTLFWSAEFTGANDMNCLQFVHTSTCLSIVSCLNQNRSPSKQDKQTNKQSFDGQNIVQYSIWKRLWWSSSAWGQHPARLPRSTGQVNGMKLGFCLSFIYEPVYFPAFWKQLKAMLAGFCWGSRPAQGTGKKEKLKVIKAHKINNAKAALMFLTTRTSTKQREGCQHLPRGTNRRISSPVERGSLASFNLAV